jgi:histone H3/H4
MEKPQDWAGVHRLANEALKEANRLRDQANGIRVQDESINYRAKQQGQEVVDSIIEQTHHSANEAANHDHSQAKDIIDEARDLSSEAKVLANIAWTLLTERSNSSCKIPLES